MSKKEWDELDFNLSRDGRWATAEEIKQRIIEKEKERTRNVMTVWGIVLLSGLLMALVVWLMI